MQKQVLTSPFPAYQNVPAEPQFYAPNQYFISAISLGATTTVTTTVNNNLIIGNQVRLIIPQSFGSRQLNEQTGYVIGLPASNQVTLNINSIGVDPFILSSANTQAQLIPIGDINSGAINQNGINSTLTYVPGSFINISPL